MRGFFMHSRHKPGTQQPITWQQKRQLQALQQELQKRQQQVLQQQVQERQEQRLLLFCRKRTEQQQR